MRDDHNAELLARWRVGEFRYMDLTRMFERILDGNHFGLVFVELRKWLLLIRIFPNKSSRRLVEGTECPRRFVRRTMPSDLLELHGDSETL